MDGHQVITGFSFQISSGINHADNVAANPTACEGIHFEVL